VAVWVLRAISDTNKRRALGQNKLFNLLERGKQLGHRISFERSGQLYWSGIGIQKVKNVYKVAVYEIAESKMASEEFEREEVRSFEDFAEAIRHIENTTAIKASDLQSCKGQRIFNPDLL
jgi:hypothetical protein